MQEIVIIGGGAAGFFTAINIAENCKNCNITILEASSNLLRKVKISGGGRCNVTHACFDPKELVEFYPRGKKELLGAFHKFMTGDMMEWLEQRGVALKIEEDGRVFPKSNQSQTIIDCFLHLAEKYHITVKKNSRVTDFYPKDNKWIVKTKNDTFTSDKVIVACGSNKRIWDITKKLNHKIIEPVPSLFTFNIKDEMIKDLGGVSVPNATIKILDTKLENYGALLITHWGLSGPAVLKLSAFGARILAEKNYHYQVQVNWLSVSFEEMLLQLNELKQKNARKTIGVKSPFSALPKRLWERIIIASGNNINENWAELSKNQLRKLCEQLTKSTFNANGKSTFKDEFVTAGGIDLKDINCQRFESKKHPNLFFAGEVLNVDGVTGGFNFQNAWTTGWLVSQAICKDLL